MNSEMTAFARGLKCGGFGAYGFDPIGVAVHAAPGVSAAARPPS
jgi:hypothetical protein